jgi:hypothetical protein
MTTNEMIRTLNVTVDGNTVRVRDGQTPEWQADKAAWDAYLASHGEDSFEDSDELEAEGHAYAALCNAVPAIE